MNSALHGRATGGVHPSPSPAVLIRERGSLALDVALIDEASDPLAASSKELSAMPRVEPGKIENAVSKIGCETPCGDLCRSQSDSYSASHFGIWWNYVSCFSESVELPP
jgi:hypothetical protein